MTTFDELFDRFQHTAFRYEGQRVYSVPAEAVPIQAWREGRARPERSLRTSPWLRRVAVTTAAGKQWSRVRVVDHPLPEYLRYEIGGYVESQACGEQILMLDREQAVGAPDFWLFDVGTDHATAMVMDYTAGGEFLGFRLVAEGSAELASLVLVHQQVVAHAVPLNEWLAAEQVNA